MKNPRLRLWVICPHTQEWESRRLRLSGEYSRVGLKTRESWCNVLGNIIYCKYDSILNSALAGQGMVDWAAYCTKLRGSSGWQRPRGVSRRERLEAELELELSRQWLESELSFPRLRYYLWFSHSILGWEFLFINCRFQPPSILPISSSCSLKWTYFLLSRAVTSHANCKSNFNRSTFEIVFPTSESFSSPDE